MTAAAPVIDLDAGPPPASRRRVPPRRVPWWAVPLVLAAVVPATLGLRPPAPMVPVAQLPPGTMRLAAAGDAFYVLRGNGTLAWNVTAYAWSDGTERWRRPLAGPDPDLVVAGPLVLVTHQPCDPRHPASVDRLDPVTGRPLWTAPGAVQAVTAGGDVLLAEGAGCGTQRRVTAVTATGPDGTARWTVRFPGGRLIVTGPDWFAAVDGSGALDTYTLRGGDRIGGGTVTETSRLIAAGGSVITADQPERDRPGVLSGLPHAAPRPAWSIPLDGTAEACGPLLCVTGPPTVTRAVDPATGRTRWTAAELGRPVPGPAYLITEAAAGARVVRWRDGRDRTLPGWRLLPAVDGSAAPVVLRGAAVGVVDLTIGRLDVLGTLPAAPARCLAGPSGTGLVCADPDGRTRLWRATG